MEELDIHTLKLQNRELVSKLRQLNSEIERVSASQKATENSHLQSQKQLLAMASCWDQVRTFKAESNSKPQQQKFEA